MVAQVQVWHRHPCCIPALRHLAAHLGSVVVAPGLQAQPFGRPDASTAPGHYLPVGGLASRHLALVLVEALHRRAGAALSLLGALRPCGALQQTWMPRSARLDGFHRMTMPPIRFAVATTNPGTDMAMDGSEGLPRGA